jgi:hypothetical protein
LQEVFYVALGKSIVIAAPPEAVFALLDAPTGIP